MSSVVNLEYPVRHDPGINGGRCQLAVSQKLGKGLEIAPAIEKMGGKCVTEHVWRDLTM
jgi:hypothetical protein